MMGKFLEIYPVCVLVLNLSKFAITFEKKTLGIFFIPWIQMERDWDLDPDPHYHVCRIRNTAAILP